MEVDDMMYVLVTYDISMIEGDGTGRLRKVSKICKNYGQRVQNSVFECKVDSTQCKQMELSLEEVIDVEHDSLRFYYLGKSKELKVKHVGAKSSYDLEKAIIV